MQVRTDGATERNYFTARKKSHPSWGKLFYRLVQQAMITDPVITSQLRGGITHEIENEAEDIIPY